MSKVIINSIVYSNSEKETLKEVKGILKDNKISYFYDEVMVNINILKDKVFLQRESTNMKLNLEFQLNKTLKTNYFLKDLNLEFIVETKTKILDIKNESIKIEYDLFINDEFSDSFTYILEWRDLK